MKSVVDPSDHAQQVVFDYARRAGTLAAQLKSALLAVDTALQFMEHGELTLARRRLQDHRNDLQRQVNANETESRASMVTQASCIIVPEIKQ